MRSEYIAAIILGICILISSIIVVKAKRVARKELRDAVNKACIEWAKTFDYIREQHEHAVNSFEYSLSLKNELIEEKQRRIEELEQQIAINETVMSAVKIIDIAKDQIREKPSVVDTLDIRY